MIKKLFTILVFAGLLGTAYAQDSTATEESAPEAVRDMFSCPSLIDVQTTINPMKGAKELIIQHKFSKIEKLSDLYGIYGPSNVRLAMHYGITEKLMAGFGTEKNNKLQEIYWKYAILTQKTSGMPVSLSYYGNVTIDARAEEVFGSNYKFSNRLSFFHQLIIAKKFGERVSVLLAPGYSHFNAVDSNFQNDAYNITFAGRVKIWNEISFIGEYDYSKWIKSVKNYQKDFTPQPNIAFGIEKATGTHSFQVFASTYDRLNPQKNYVFNQIKLDGLMLGFVITARL